MSVKVSTRTMMVDGAKGQAAMLVHHAKELGIGTKLGGGEWVFSDDEWVALSASYATRAARRAEERTAKVAAKKEATLRAREADRKRAEWERSPEGRAAMEEARIRRAAEHAAWQDQNERAFLKRNGLPPKALHDRIEDRQVLRAVGCARMCIRHGWDYGKANTHAARKYGVAVYDVAKYVGQHASRSK